MEEAINEQMEISAQPAEAEETLGATDKPISLGKFKDVQSLLSAYNSLQAEFTKRCQRLKQLEGQQVDKEQAPTQEVITQEEGTTLSETEILKEYLKGVLQLKPQAVVIDGAGAGLSTPPQKIKDVSTAGSLAREMFSKNSN